MPDHGTRACYKAGCRLDACRAAEAGYRSYLRRLKVMGKLPLGVRINAVKTWRLVRQMRSDGLTQAELARRLGFKTANLQFGRRSITLRNATKVKGVFDPLMAEGSDEAIGYEEGTTP